MSMSSTSRGIRPCLLTITPPKPTTSVSTYTAKPESHTSTFLSKSAVIVSPLSEAISFTAWSSKLLVAELSYTSPGQTSSNFSPSDPALIPLPLSRTPSSLSTLSSSTRTSPWSTSGPPTPYIRPTSHEHLMKMSTTVSPTTPPTRIIPTDPKPESASPSQHRLPLIDWSDPMTILKLDRPHHAVEPVAVASPAPSDTTHDSDWTLLDLGPALIPEEVPSPTIDQQDHVTCPPAPSLSPIPSDNDDITELVNLEEPVDDGVAVVLEWVDIAQLAMLEFALLLARERLRLRLGAGQDVPGWSLFLQREFGVKLRVDGKMDWHWRNEWDPVVGK